MAWSTEISQLVTETEQFIAAVETKKIILDAGVDAATLDAAEALAAVVSSNTSAVNSITSADVSKGHAVATEAIANFTKIQQDSVSDAERQASLAAGYALSAGTIVQQDLSGINAEALHRSPNAVTSMFIYDTSKDSDGGAWTEKCQNTSWYNEDITGKWLGQQANEADARYAGSSLGSELATGWFNSTSGWAITGTLTTVSGGILKLSAGENLYRGTGLPRGTYYVLTFDVTNITGGGFRIATNNGGDSSNPITTNGQKTIRIFDRNNGSGGYIMFASVSSGTATISNLSIKEAIATTISISNDYFQLTTDGKFYRLWNNILKGTSAADLNNTTYWTKTNITSVSTDGYIIPTAGTAATTSLTQSFTNIATGTKLTLLLKAKADILSKIWIGYANTGNAYAAGIVLDVTSGSTVVYTNIGGGTIAVISSFVDTDGYRQFKLNLSGGNGDALTGIRIAPTTLIASSPSQPNVQFNQTTFDGTSGLFIKDIHLEWGTRANITYEAKGVQGSTSEVFRGNKRDFPRLAAIVAESNNLTIYDLTEPGRPMWMRFLGNPGFLAWLSSAINISGISAVNGYIVPVSSSNMGGLVLNFAKDDAILIWNGSYILRKRQLVDRNVLNSFSAEPGGFIIAGTLINGIAMTVLSDAPTDPVTGLKVPTIALATSTGLSFIRHNGTVTSITDNFYLQYAEVAFEKRGSIVARHSSSAPFFTRLTRYFKVPETNLTIAAGGTVGSNGYSIDTSLMRMPNSGGAYKLLPNILRADGNITLYKEDVANGIRSLTATVNPAFNTGWMPGDTKTTLLAETSTVAATEPTSIVTNGDFSTSDVSFWSVVANATTAVVSGRLELTATANYGGIFSSVLYGVPGGLYWIEGELVSGTGRFTLAGGYWDPDFDNYDRTGPYKFEGYFRTRSTDGYFQPNLRTAVSGATTIWDNIKIIKVDEDRSHNNRGAQVKGSVTRTPVATGSSLVGYSGFSTTNYLQQPYNEKLEFGVGEFSASTWVNIPATITSASFPTVGSAVTATGWTNSGWDTFSTTGGSFTASKTITGGNDIALSTNTVAAILGTWYKVTITVSATTVDAYNISLTSSTNSRSTQASATGTGTKVLYIKANVASGNFTLAVISATLGSITVDSATIQEIGPVLVFDRNYTAAPCIRMGVTAGGNITAEAFDGTTTRTATTTSAYNTAQWLKAETSYTTDGSLGIRVNGREVAVTRGNPLISLDSRYNLLNSSERFDTATWSKRLSTAPSNVLTATAASGDHAITNGSYISTVTGLLTATVTAKQGTSQYLWITLSPVYGLGNYATVIVDLIGGTVTKTQQGGSVTISATTVVSAPDVDGYRAINVYVSSSAAGMGIILGIAQSATASITTYGSVDFTAAGTETILLKNAQLQRGPTALAYQLVDPVVQGAASFPPVANFNFAAPMTIGNSYTIDAPFPGSIALLKLSATVPTAEQSIFMYEQEKQLFRTGAISILPDATSVLDMSYDDATDRWSTISATNESYWTGLIRNAVTPVPAGSYSKITTTSGIELTSRITTNPGVDVTIPTYLLREDLNKRAEAASKTFKEIVNFDYVGGFTASTTIGSTAITSVSNLTYPVSTVGARISGTGIPTNATIVAVVGTTIYISAAAAATATGVSITFLDFNLPTGFEAETVATAGAIRREGTTADFTRLFDGFIEIIRFAVAPGVTTWVQIQASRIVS